MDAFAVFFDWWRATPVFHRFDSDRLAERGAGYTRSFTRCGLLVSSHADGEFRRLREFGSWIPLKHAAKFGRPCRKCFPEAAA